MDFKDSGKGLLIPEHKIIMGGRFHIEHRRPVYEPHLGFSCWETLSEEDVDNIVVNQGLNHILGVEFDVVTQITQWFLGLFQGNYTPVATDTAATIPGNSTECSSYTSATRPLWQPAAASGQSITNSANPAIFTFNTNVTIYGAFLASLATIGGTGGTLFAAAQFSASKAVANLDQLLVTYTFNAASA
jgi:hypothetical protein